jgi:hypothetical protein
MAHQRSGITLDLTGRDEPPKSLKLSMKDTLIRAPVE